MLRQKAPGTTAGVRVRNRIGLRPGWNDGMMEYWNNGYAKQSD
jgi:hypothetical protein